MSVDPIRDLLATLARATMGLPAGHVAVALGHVEAHGADVEAVRAWVEARGGWLENPPAPRRAGLRPAGRWNRPRPAARAS